MDNKLNFSQQRVATLPIPEKGRVDYHDSGCPKLTCRVSSTGAKSFVLLKWNGKTMQRVTLGRTSEMTVAHARTQATEALLAIGKGIDPNEEKRKQHYRSITLNELLETYLKDKSDLRPATISDYTKKINQGFSDWLNKPVNKITRDMVKAKRNSFTGGRDNKMRVLRLLLTYAHKTLRIINENPIDILTEGKLWAKSKRRARMIPSEHLKAWYQAVLNLENEKAKVYLLLLLHTGLRDQDVRYLQWKDIDFKNDCFITRNTKNHTDFTAFIAPQIKPYLRALQKSSAKNDFVFPGDTKDGVMGIPRRPIIQVCKETGIEFSSHDLKRTFLTIGEATMIPFSLLKALANHNTNNDVTGGYINPETKTLKSATFKIADYIQQHTSIKELNIVTLKTGLN